MIIDVGECKKEENKTERVVSLTRVEIRLHNNA